MKRNITGQVAVVTGAGSGIGREIAKELAENGAKVMLLGRSLETLQATKQLIENNDGYAECHVVDVLDKVLLETIFDTICKEHGKIEILISNAGNTANPSFITDTSEEGWDSVIKTHLYGAFNCVQLCAKKMKENNYGRIVIMSSLGGVHGLTGQLSYATAKTGIVGMTYTLAKELGPYGITVNSLQPGIIETQMTEGPLQLAKEQFIAETPVRRIGNPKDVSNAVMFLCDKKSSFVNGVIMRVDGGYSLNSGMDQLLFQISDTEI